MNAQRFTDKQKLLLRYLAIFKFLTYAQMIRLGIGKYSSNLSTLTKQLSSGRYPFIRKIPHGVGGGAIFYLTKKGKDALLALGVPEEQISFPIKAISEATKDTKHRTETIDIHIALYLACWKESVKIEFCDRYFDTTGNSRTDRNLQSKTAIIYEGNKTLKADITAMLSINETQKELYLIEHERGKDSKKSAEKIIIHGKAIFMGSANQKYQYQKAYRTLWIFEYESTLLAVQKRLKENSYLSNIQEFFLFKSLEEISADTFFVSWRNLRGAERKMYYNE